MSLQQSFQSIRARHDIWVVKSVHGHDRQEQFDQFYVVLLREAIGVEADIA